MSHPGVPLLVLSILSRHLTEAPQACRLHKVMEPIGEPKWTKATVAATSEVLR
ncbi:unnamed protein product [Nyctereutes procyonoides]|uniref:(raccoon dog) hypothetical protein n=1 Tax=Nyctereutes procyonoides TaxID=34880 RepID=A0A811Y6L3_NYCPR|nr:unnamed protein product [Nyctereutes procyonoides]